jgi:hypothetical protein
MQRAFLVLTLLLALALNAAARDPWGGGGGSSFAGGTVAGATTFSGDVDFRANISNGGSATCFTGVTGVPCFTESAGFTSAGDTLISMRAGTTSTTTGLSFFGSDNTFRHGLQYFGSAHAAPDLRSKVFLYAGASGGAIVLGNGSTDVAAGTNIVEERDGSIGINLLGTMDGAGRRSSALFGSLTNCSSSAAPAVCAAAPLGSVVIAAAATTVTVNTTAVTANSQIVLQEDSSLGTKLGVTCNTTYVRDYYVTARTAGTSFVITASAAPVTNPACLTYEIKN